MIQKIARTSLLALILLVKRTPYILVTSLCLYALIYLFQLSFYRYAPPSIFLRVQSATVDTAQVNQQLNFTLCRYARDTYSEAVGVRSFFKVDDDRRNSAGTYTFKATYERGETCQIIKIPADRHPQESGNYYFETTVRFVVPYDKYAFTKEYTYQSETFRLSDTVQGLQEQIKGLQTEIEVLKQILRARGVEVPETQPAATTPTTSATTTPAVVNDQPSTNPAPMPPVATAPPDPQPPQVTTSPLVDVKTPLSPVLCLSALGIVKVC